MKLSILHEGFPDDLAQNFTAQFKKQADPGRPELTGDPSDRGDSTIKQPSRSGNQNTPMRNPRHRRFFKAPADGGSLEDGSEQPEEEDGILNPGLTMRTERPVPNRAGPPPL